MANASKKKQRPDDETLEQDNGGSAPNEDSEADEQGDAAQGGNTGEDTPQDDARDVRADSEPDAGISTAPIVRPEPATPSIPLHARLEKAVRTMSHSGNPDAAHALNKVELLIGTLKHSLPNAISAISGEQIKAELEALLATL